MKHNHTLRAQLTALLSAIAIFATQTPADACTRALYVATDGTILTGRSMDWGEDMHSNMWVLPRGMKRDGGGGKDTVTWQSKYGSLVVSAYDIGSCDGMNEKGLAVNMLALVESDYGKPAEGGKIICMNTWAQYILDKHATIAETVADLRKEEFRVQTLILPTGRPANMHLAISDASGDSAIFEYVKGKLVIHHGKEFKVLTNSPTYDQQLAIMEYWKLAGGLRANIRFRAAGEFMRVSGGQRPALRKAEVRFEATQPIDIAGKASNARPSGLPGTCWTASSLISRHAGRSVSMIAVPNEGAPIGITFLAHRSSSCG